LLTSVIFHNGYLHPALLNKGHAARSIFRPELDVVVVVVLVVVVAG
jgi:hypothetical protein